MLIGERRFVCLPGSQTPATEERTVSQAVESKKKRYTGRWHRLQSVAASAEKALSCRNADLGGNTAPCMGLP